MAVLSQKKYQKFNVLSRQLLLLTVVAVEPAAYSQWSAITPTAGVVPPIRRRASMVYVPPAASGTTYGVSVLTEGTDYQCFSGPPANLNSFVFFHSQTGGQWQDTGAKMKALSPNLSGGLGGCPIVGGSPTGNLNNCNCLPPTAPFCTQNPGSCCFFRDGIDGAPMVFWERDHLGNSVNLLFRYGGLMACSNTNRLNQYWFASPSQLQTGTVPGGYWESYNSQSPPGQVPSPRFDHAMVYVPFGSGTDIDGMVVLTGGNTSPPEAAPMTTYIARLDTSVSTEKRLIWKKLISSPGCLNSAAVAPIQVFGHDLFFDPIRKKLIQSRGFYNSGGNLPEASTIEWNAKFVDANCNETPNGNFVKWEAVTSLPTVTNGGARGFAARAFHGGLGKPFSYGGQNTIQPPLATSQFPSGLNLYAAYAAIEPQPRDWWKTIPNSSAPGPRAFASMVYVTALNKIFMFGGYRYQTGAWQNDNFNDSWYYQAPVSTSVQTGIQNVACRPTGATVNATVEVLNAASSGIGTQLRVKVRAAPNSPVGSVGGVLYIGLSQINAPLDPFGMLGCLGFNTPDFAISFSLDANGEAIVEPFVTPFDFNLVGIQLYMQAVLLSPQANPAGLTASDGLGFGIGF